MSIFQKFFEVSVEPQCVIDDKGSFQYVNASFCSLLGYTADELKDRPFIGFVHTHDRERTVNEFYDIKDKGTATIEFENKYVCRDGTCKILSWCSVRDPETELIFATVRDKTRKFQEESYLRQTVEAIQSAAIVAITDKKGKIIFANDNFCKISGYDREELIGQDHRILKSGLHSDEFFKDLWQTIKAGKVWTGEIKNRSKHNRIYTVQSVITPLTNANGEIESFLAIRFDVTKLKESERKLQEVQARAKIGSWSYNLTKEMFEWSEQMHQLFDIDASLGSLKFTDILALIVPEDRKGVLEAIAQSYKQKLPFQVKFRSVFPEKRVWIEMHGYPCFDGQGIVTGLGGTCRDITELVKAEEETRLERTKALHSSKLASLGEMAACIAHEINNPLAIISGSAAILPDFRESEELFKGRVAAIEKATERITKIVTGLRKFSRSSEKKDYHLHSLHEILKEVLVLTETKAKKFGVVTSVSVETNEFISCDEVEIEQVLINLINNSVDAIKGLPEKWIQIRIKEEQQAVVIQIRDSGKGIPKEVARKLFDPFFTTKPVGEGTGLGLSITKGILDEHKASIGLVEADPHTCFEIKFQKVRAGDVAA